MPKAFPPQITRRAALGGLALTSAALAAGRAGAQATLLPAKSCVLTPQQDEGPFYFDPKLVRADITEGRKGAPMRLLLQAVEAGSCAPISGARIDVWHADALGQYSGYPGQGDNGTVSTVKQTFMRGTQFADQSGQAAFDTVYPGWYPGRTPHIHFKVYLDDKSVSVGQIYFPDALSEFLYRNIAPYNQRRRARDTTNTTDMLLRAEGGRSTFCSIKEEADRYLAMLVIGIDRSGAASRRAPAPPDGPRPRRGSLVPGVAAQR